MTFLYIKTTLVSFIYVLNSGDRAITMVPWRWWYLVEPQYGHQPPHSWKGYHAGVNGWCWGVNPCMQQRMILADTPFFFYFVDIEHFCNFIAIKIVHNAWKIQIFSKFQLSYENWYACIQINVKSVIFTLFIWSPIWRNKR